MQRRMCTLQAYQSINNLLLVLENSKSQYHRVGGVAVQT